MKWLLSLVLVCAAGAACHTDKIVAPTECKSVWVGPDLHKDTLLTRCR